MHDSSLIPVESHILSYQMKPKRCHKYFTKTKGRRSFCDVDIGIHIKEPTTKFNEDKDKQLIEEVKEDKDRLYDFAKNL